MTILTIRTDKPEAEVGIYVDGKRIAYEIWEAHRQLAETIHTKIEQILSSQNLKLTDIEGIVVFEGPGSFTGLRIGVSVANALSYGLGIPIIGSSKDDWIEGGLEKLKTGTNDHQVVPEYGAPVFTTQQRK